MKTAHSVLSAIPETHHCLCRQRTDEEEEDEEQNKEEDADVESN